MSSQRVKGHSSVRLHRSGLCGFKETITLYGTITLLLLWSGIFFSPLTGKTVSSTVSGDKSR